MAFDPAVCVAAAQRFGTARFQAALRAIVEEAVAAERAPRPEERPAVVTGLLQRRRCDGRVRLTALQRSAHVSVTREASDASPHFGANSA